MKEIDINEDYYDKLFSFKRDLTETEKKRIINTIDMIPSDVSSVLEVGCGDGRIINSLINKYPKLCGLDISSEALKKVKTPKIKGNLEKLPFPDNSYDIVICCEVLEHLPYPIYEKSLNEIERVAKDYILISVPNNENLDKEIIKCPKCGCSFHKWRHLRSFDEKKLNRIFKNFKIIENKKQLLEQILFEDNIIKIRNFFKKNANFPKTSLCPQCSYSGESQSTERINLKNPNPILKFLPKKKAMGWTITLYQFRGKNEL